MKNKLSTFRTTLMFSFDTWHVVQYVGSFVRIGCSVVMSSFYLQCTPEQISSDLYDELMYQLDHDDNLQKVSQLSLRQSSPRAFFTYDCVGE